MTAYPKYPLSVTVFIIEKAREFHKDQYLFITFIDLRAVFDLVDHLALWSILNCIGVPDKLANLLSKLYDGAECCVRVNGKDSAWFSVDSGVQHGCMVAPDLLNYVVDHLMTYICQQTTGVQLGNYYLMYLEYAKDTIMFSNTITELKVEFIVFQEEASKLELQVSWEKTQRCSPHTLEQHGWT